MNDRNRAGPDRLSLLRFSGFFTGLMIVIFITSLVTAEVCLDCHDEMAESVKGTTHEYPAVACASCHQGDEHADDPSVDNIINPGKVTGLDAVNSCSECHSVHQSLDNYGFDIHSNQELACGSCHQVHGGDQKLLLDDSAEFCQGCHTETKTKFAGRSSHPVASGPMTCLSCHTFTERAKSDLSFDLGRVCQGCHPNEGGPFLYEHEGVNVYSVEGGGCVECHEPHGSQNDHLLKQPGNQLCKQCHADHMTRNHDRLWDEVYSKLACQTCHTDLHGSLISSHLLASDMPIKLGGGDCYRSGCHSLTGQ